jgi:hypothetical protein
MRRETFRNRALEAALVALVVYGIAFYVLNLPSWVKVAGGIVIGAAWLYLYVASPAIRAVNRKRVKGHS